MSEETLLFRNTHITDKKIASEFCRCTYPKWRKTITYAYLPIGLLMGFVGVLYEANSGFGNIRNVILSVGAIILSITMLLSQKNAIHTNAKQLLKRMSGRTTKISCYDKHFTIEAYNETVASAYSENSKVVSEYSCIGDIISAKIGLYIAFENKVYVLIRKDSFTLGDYEEFVTFLRGKLSDKPKLLKKLK